MPAKSLGDYFDDTLVLDRDARREILKCLNELLMSSPSWVNGVSMAPMYSLRDDIAAHENQEADDG